MGRDSIGRLLFRFSGPAVAANLVGASYNLVDALFVGRLGTEALAALAVSNPLMTIFRSVGVGIGIGASSLIARRLGAGDKEGANKAAAGSITLFAMVSTVVTIICLFNLKFLLRLFGADDSVLPPALSYMTVETAFMPLDFLLLVLAELIRVEGNPVLASVAMITSGVTNCVFDPLLGFGIGPFPKLGMAGFAFATSIGRAIAVTMILVYMISGRSAYRFKRNYFRPNWKIAKDIYGIGASMTVRMAGGSISQIIANRVAVGFGVIPLALVGLFQRTCTFAFAPSMGIGQGMMPLAGYNYGAKKLDRVGEVVTKAAFLGFAWGLFFWTVATIFSVPITSVFSHDAELLSIAGPAFRIYIIGVSTVGAQIILSFFFQSIGRKFPAMIITASRQVILLIPILLILPRIFGENGLWAAYPTADLLSIALTLVWVNIEFRRQQIPVILRKKKIKTVDTAS
jgi:putative MATE family efflux protein